MARKKTVPGLPDMDDSKESFDIGSTLTIASVIYEIRETIMARSIEKSQVKKCIPNSVVVSVIKELGLDKYLPKKEN